MDISYSMKEKALLYSEDIRASLFSLKSALEVVKNKASEESYNKFYVNAMADLSNKLDNKDIIASASNTNKTNAFIPSSNKNDVTYQTALFAM